MKACWKFLLLSVLVLFAASTFASTIDVVTPAPANQQYQQTLNSPCIFGDSSCKSPSGWTFTSIAGGGQLQNWGVPTAITSPTYTYQQIVDAILGNAFIVGIDINQANHQDPTLTYFGEFVSSNGGAFTEVASYGVSGSGSGGTELLLTNNGNGYADALLTNLVALNPGDEVYFALSYINANDGTEEFFLINTSAPPPVVPEPSSLALLGTGLVGAAGAIRRRFFR